MGAGVRKQASTGDVPARPVRRHPRPGFALSVAEWATLGAAMLHLWVVPDHWRQWSGYGAFFVAVFITQGVYSLALPRLAHRLPFLGGGAVATIGLLGLWLETHLRHAPVGPHRLHADEFGAVDLASAALETVAVIALVVLMKGLIDHRSPAEAQPSPSKWTTPTRRRTWI